MLRADVEADLRDAHLEDGFLFPAYEDYCFASVPHTLAAVLGVDTGRSLPESAGQTLPETVFAGVDTDVERVVLVLVDGYGLAHWKRDRREHRLLDVLTDRGTVTPLTSVYPSETAAAITSLHTGRSPVEHGLLGWDMYFEEFDAVLETLPFRTPDGRAPGEALGRSVDPGVLFEGRSLYPRLADAGVDSHLFVPATTVGTAYSGLVNEGGIVHPYEGISTLARELRRTLEGDATSPEYYYVYLPHIDAAAHHHGTDADEYQAQLSRLSEGLFRALVDELGPHAAADTLLVVTADHGHVDTDPDRAIDMLAHPEVRDRLRTRSDGEPIPPVGGPRNAHLHLRDGAVEAVRGFLESTYDVLAVTREEALSRQLFGPGSPTDRFHRRCGDLIVVHRDRAAYHFEDGQPYVGLHGGLHPREMLVPFAAARLDALQ